MRDTLLLAVVIISLGIGFFVLYNTFNTSIDAMLGITQINESSTAVSALESTKELTNQFDYVIFGVFIALTLGIIISGWLIGGYPILMFIYLLIIIISTIIAGVFGYVWEQVSQASVFGASVAAFPLTNHILNNMTIYVAVIGIVGTIVMFAKPYFMGEQ